VRSGILARDSTPITLCVSNIANVSAALLAFSYYFECYKSNEKLHFFRAEGAGAFQNWMSVAPPRRLAPASPAHASTAA
jgi:hypothetical protein